LKLKFGLVQKLKSATQDVAMKANAGKKKKDKIYKPKTANGKEYDGGAPPRHLRWRGAGAEVIISS
jgi:hypothetical protein